MPLRSRPSGCKVPNPPTVAVTGLCLVVLRVHNAVFLNLWLVVVVHRRDVVED